MDEFEFPCPKCSEPLISDEETAGTEAICPYCDKLIVMPSKAQVTKKAPEVVENSHLPTRRHIGTPLPEAENIPVDSIPTEVIERRSSGDATHLPSGRARQDREDFDRLAAMASGPQIDPLDAAPTKGKVSFHCPGCARLIWIRPKDAGMIVNCAGCSQEVVCPQKGKEARLLNPSAKIPTKKAKTDLPSHRSADHLPSETMSNKREDGAKRTMLPSGPNRPGRTLGNEPAAPPMQKATVKPIPKQRDVEISPSELKRYRAASKERKIQRAMAPHEDSKSPLAGSGKTTLPPSRGSSPSVRSSSASSKGTPAAGGSESHRLNEDRAPAFTAREELERQMVDNVDSSDGWGNTTESPGGGGRRLLLVALVLGLPAVAAAIFFFLQNQDSASTVSVEEEIVDTSIEEAEAAQSLLREFLNARTIDEQLPLVRHPEITKPRMLVHAEQGRPPLPQVSKFGWADSAPISGKEFMWIDVEFNDGNSRTAVFEVTEEGMKLDWESFVLFADPPMSEFVSRQPAEPGVYRVTCTLGDYYNHLYRDEFKFLCLEILGADEVSSCWAYTDTNSEVAVRLAQLFATSSQRLDPDNPNSKSGIRIMLKLHFEKDENGKSNSQAWIDDIVSESWMIP